MVTHGLSLSTVLAIAKQLMLEVTGRYGWKRVAILDRIQWDVFRHYYGRVQPHFATFFLNSTAHLQHKFWRNMDPDAFTIKPSAREQAELQNAVRFGYEQMDSCSDGSWTGGRRHGPDLLHGPQPAALSPLRGLRRKDVLQSAQHRPACCVLPDVQRTPTPTRRSCPMNFIWVRRRGDGVTGGCAPCRL